MKTNPTTKKLGKTRKELFDLVNNHPNMVCLDDYTALSIIQYSKQRVARKWLQHDIPGYTASWGKSEIGKKVDFIERHVFLKMDLFFAKLLCDVLNDPNKLASDFTKKELNIIGRNYIKSKTIKVYSKILETMIFKTSYFTKDDVYHEKVALLLIQALYLIFTSYEYSKEFEDLPF